MSVHGECLAVDPWPGGCGHDFLCSSVESVSLFIMKHCNNTVLPAG